MAVKYIKNENCLILLAITMKGELLRLSYTTALNFDPIDDIENQMACLLAREADPQGERTIGVLTKPDTIETGGPEERWKRVFIGLDNPLKLGYYVTKQPNPKELQDKISFVDARDREVAFFASMPLWSNMDTFLRSRLGTANLVKFLSDQLSGAIGAR